MDKSTGAAVDGGLLQLQPCVGGLHGRVTSSSSEVNEKTSSFRAGNSAEAQTIRTLAQQHWPNTFRLDCTVLGQPMGRVTRQLTWEQYLGRPMVQPKPGTCAPVACTVCVEAVYRFEHGKLHGETAAPCNDLIEACRRDGIWTPGKGANVGKVLTKIQEMGGVPTTTSAPTPAPCVLPLRSWKEHSLWDYRDGGSVAGHVHDRVAELLERHGPCIVVLWVCPWYHRFDADADADDTLVYRGCGRNDGYRRMIELLYHHQVGWHAVVCFAYRFCGQQMHVQVLDNHSATGPRRWIDVEELHTLYTLSSE